jgi:DNA-binding IclR family transcriptional regulator
MTTPYARPSMAARMSAILDAFDAPFCRRSLPDIAFRTGLPVSTTHRILDQLVDLGWVEHTTDGYLLGQRARRFCDRVDPTSALREAAAPHIEEFVRRTPFVVHLAVLEGPYVRYLDKAGGPHATQVPSRVGGLLPAHRTAVGKAMLAYVTADALELTLQQAAGEHEVDAADVAGVRRALARVRRHGLAREGSGSLASVACLGAPIFGAGGQLVGGISLCDPGKGKTLDRFGAVVTERARRISARMAPPSVAG